MALIFIVGTRQFPILPENEQSNRQVGGGGAEGGAGEERGRNKWRELRDNGSGSALIRYLADFPIHVGESEGKKRNAEKG